MTAEACPARSRPGQVHLAPEPRRGVDLHRTPPFAAESVHGLPGSASLSSPLTGHAHGPHPRSSWSAFRTAHRVRTPAWHLPRVYRSTEPGKRCADLVTQRAPVRVSRVGDAAEESSREFDDAAAVADVVFEGVAARVVEAARVVAPRPQAVADRDDRFPGEAPKEPGERDVPEFERPPSPTWTHPPDVCVRCSLTRRAMGSARTRDSRGGSRPRGEARWGGGGRDSCSRAPRPAVERGCVTQAARCFPDSVLCGVASAQFGASS